MTKIKNIYSFGTSFSNAGGFEFHRKPHMRDYYKCLDIPLEKSKVQYTYLLSQLLEKTINCTNLSKDGFGNERIYRKIHEITHQKNFIPEENLFIIEFSDFLFVPSKPFIPETVVYFKMFFLLGCIIL